VSAGLTTTETRLVERYVWVLDLMSRCAQGIDGGDWYYLADKAGDLAAKAERLAEVAGEIAQAVHDGRRRPRPRPCAPRSRSTAATTARGGCCTRPATTTRGTSHDR